MSGMSGTRRHGPAWLAAVVSAVLTATLLSQLSAGPVSAGASVPPRTERVRIGTSVQGRPIVAVHRWYPGAADRTVLVIGSIHGDERAGLRVVTRLTRRRLPANLDLWVVRTVNPDGTAAHRRTNARGVDLNRNFPYRWRKTGVGTSTYSGPSELSEPESRALRRLVRRIEPRLTVTFHMPLFGVGRNVKRNGVSRALARRMRLPLKSFSCTGVCHGSFTSWYNRTRPGVAVTVEFGPARVPDWRIGRATRAVVAVGSTR